ncbi:MAG TPA: zinc-binding dehydrogenase [Chloroflexi bacterium]|jgi:Zn-dependent alcohol dehydrogenase|nr:zinc-binding dehydrogenase [Chloroflexota bacterium]
MKAAVCYAFDRPLSVEEVRILPPQRGEVMVKLAATAICHSDIHFLSGARDVPAPMVVGHEAAGVVHEVGEGVTLVNQGRRVVVSLLRSCGRCEFCIAGETFLCDFPFALNTESRLRNSSGEPLPDRGMNVSAFAEYAIVDQSQLVPLPDDVQFDRACLLACGVITGVGAIVNTANTRPGQSVVVVGTGGVGLNAIQGALIAGANPIIAVDVLAEKLSSAIEFGATHTVQLGRDDVPGAVRGVTGGKGAHVVAITTGVPEAVSLGIELVRPGGSLVLVGLPSPHATVPFQIRSFVNSGARILGSPMGSTRLREDVPWLVDLYRAGRLKLDELITGRYPLDQINEAIASTQRGEALRNVIVF